MKANNKILFTIGVGFVVVSLTVFLATFFPVIKEEIKYAVKGGNEGAEILIREPPIKEPPANQNANTQIEDQKPKDISEIVAADPEFSIIIPKINANSKVILNVDPINSKEYQQKLAQGVAHAKGTDLPGQEGNTFLFAHSTDTFYNANRYNAVFYLLNKMKYGDKFYIVFEEDLYEYVVKEVSIVESDDVDYLKSTDGEYEATLMTCWPPGTTNKRLVVVGDLVEN